MNYIFCLVFFWVFKGPVMTSYKTFSTSDGEISCTYFMCTWGAAGYDQLLAYIIWPIKYSLN